MKLSKKLCGILLGIAFCVIGLTSCEGILGEGTTDSSESDGKTETYTFKNDTILDAYDYFATTQKFTFTGDDGTEHSNCE